MHSKSPQGSAAQSVFLSSVHGLANVLAVVIAFFGTPPVYGHTVGWVSQFTAYHYGAEFGDLASLVWFVLVACLIFFTARASVSTLLIMGGLSLALRFL